MLGVKKRHLAYAAKQTVLPGIMVLGGIAIISQQDPKADLKGLGVGFLIACIATLVIFLANLGRVLKDRAS